MRLFIGLLIFGMIFASSRIGLFVVPPNGLHPDGVTAVVWRHNDEPFFNSPDAISIRGEDAAYLVRLQYPFLYREDRVIANLPYMDWAYLSSVDGLKDRLR